MCGIDTQEWLCGICDDDAPTGMRNLRMCIKFCWKVTGMHDKRLTRLVALEAKGAQSKVKWWDD